MKNVLIMICCACLLGACDKAEVSSIYSGPDGIHFYYDQVGPFDADPYPNSSETGSLSSSEKIDTLWYKIDIMGNVSEKERKFSLKQSVIFNGQFLLLHRNCDSGRSWGKLCCF